MKVFRFLAACLVLVLTVAGCTKSEQKAPKANNANPNPGSTKTQDGPAKTEKPSEGS